MIDDDTKKMLRQLRLGGLLAHWDEWLKTAAKGNFSHVRLLKYIFEQECGIKRENSRLLKIKRARMEEENVMETFPFSRQPTLNKKRILSLYDSMDYMHKHQNVILLGPTGAGKTGIATGFLIHAINEGYTGRYIRFPELIGILYESVGDHSEQKALKKFADYDCLLIDEIGYVEIEPVQAGLFFTLLHKRHKKKTTLITSNLGFGEWSSFLKNDHLSAALIDRLTENSHVINMKNCMSIRPKMKQT